MSYNHVSLVEQLKEVVKAQNESLRYKENELKSLRAENKRLVSRIQELDAENDALKQRCDEYQPKGSDDVRENAEHKEVSIRPSTLNDSVPLSNSLQGELYTTALSSPESPSKTATALVDPAHRITVTLSSTPSSLSKTYLTLRPHNSPKKTLTRTESRKAKRKSFYELSPDISEKHVQILENCYGGKEKANHAARVIQQHYRRWAMKRAYFRLRTQSEVRRNSVKGRRYKRGSVRSTSTDELSPISPLAMSLNLSADGSDKSLRNFQGNPRTSSKTRLSEADSLHLNGSPNEEFIAIQTDLNIDENFQPVEVHNTSQGGVSIRHMSEDISSIEISKNLLNNSIGQKIIIDEVFQQILSPSRKDSFSLGSRSDSFRAKKTENAKEPVVESAPVIESVTLSESAPVIESVPNSESVTSILEVAPKCEAGSVVDGLGKNEAEEESKAEEKSDVGMVDDIPEEKPTEKEMIDSNENLPEIDQSTNGKIGDSTESFDVPASHSYSWPTLDQLLGDDTASISGNSLSPSSSIIQTFYEDKEKDLRVGVNHFNRKPKKGISYLIETGVLEDDPESVCKFLREEPGINKQKVGEYLGDLRNPFSMEVLQAFVRSINIVGKQIDEALRYFQTFFRMPGEAQKIERLVEEFSAAFVESNPGMISDNQDTILILSFAIIMLNTDLHSPNVKRKMSKEEFTRNLRGTNNGEDIPSEILSDIYDRVQKKQFKTGPDNLDAILKYEKQILGKVPWTTLALPHRQLRQLTSLYEVLHGGKRKEKAHPRVVFLFNDMVVNTEKKQKSHSPEKTVLLAALASRFLNKCYRPVSIVFTIAAKRKGIWNRAPPREQLFLENFKYGVRLLNKSNSEVLISFHAKKDDIRKTFCTELRDCIEETAIMESERINSEKTRQLTMSYPKRDLEDSISLTLPRPHVQKKKKATDSLSLMNEPTTLSENELTASKLLSSSLQDLTQEDGAFYEESSLQKSNSVTCFDYVGSISTENVWSHYQESLDSFPVGSSSGSLQNLSRKFGLFSSKRTKNPMQRKFAKSTGSLDDIKALQKSNLNSKTVKRKSEFFVQSPIAT